MRVLMLTDYFHPHVGGGVEHVVLQLARELRRLEHDVAVLTLNTVGGPAAEWLQGIRVHRVPARSFTRALGLQSAVAPGLYHRALDIAGGFQPDILHTHNLFFMVSAVAPLLARRLRLPLMTTMHLGSLRALPGARGRAARLYESVVGRWILRQSRMVLAVSDTVRAHGLSLGVPAQQILTVPNAVDPPVDPPGAVPADAGSPHVVFVGRLVLNKGPHIFVEAAVRVLSRRPDVQFHLAGDGPMRGRLEARVSRLGWAEHIRFHGHRKDVRSLLRQATLFVRPSLLEGMPLAVLEAMASGVPIVATPVGGTVDLVRHGTSGWLVPPADPAGLAQAILDLLADEPRRRALAANALEVARRHAGWDVVAGRVMTIYEGVLGWPQARRTA